MVRSRWRTWGLGLVGVLGLLLLGLVLALRYTAPCAGPPAAATGDTMRAVTARCYGPAEVLAVEQLAKPVPAEDEILVRVQVAAINPLDHHFLHGHPYAVRLAAGLGAPEDPRVGVDFAGIVEAVGAKVSRFQPGDAVFGNANGAFAEYVVRRDSPAVAKVPPGLSLEDAAAMPVAAVTALQALRDHAKVQPGHKVLINGASGGVGTYAVQIAKALGAEVTGVSSTRNVALVQGLGADHAIDYTQRDFTRETVRYDAIIDMVGNHSIGALTSVLQPEGTLVKVGSVEKSGWAPLDSWISLRIASLLHSQKLISMLADLGPGDLDTLAQMAAAGQIRSVIDTRYPLAQVQDAMRHLETGRTRGKILITVAP